MIQPVVAVTPRRWAQPERSHLATATPKLPRPPLGSGAMHGFDVGRKTAWALRRPLLLAALLPLAWLAGGCQTTVTPPSPGETASVAGAQPPGPDAPTPSPAARAPQFELPDQFGTIHQFRFPRNQITVLTVCGRKGSDDVEPWIRPLHERFGDAIAIQGLADVSAVPGLMRGLIRTLFRRSLDYPVMLDWAGDSVAPFAYDHLSVNLYVLDRDGLIVWRTSGAATPARLAEAIAAVEGFLARPSASAQARP